LLRLGLLADLRGLGGYDGEDQVLHERLVRRQLLPAVLVLHLPDERNQHLYLRGVRRGIDACDHVLGLGGDHASHRDYITMDGITQPSGSFTPNLLDTYDNTNGNGNYLYSDPDVPDTLTWSLATSAAAGMTSPSTMVTSSAVLTYNPLTQYTAATTE